MANPIFEVGQEVAVLSLRDARNRYRLDRVAAVTPTGRIKLESGDVYNPDGYNRGGTIYRSRLMPVDDKIRESIFRTEAIERLGYQKWRDFPTEKLRRLIAALDDAA